MKDLVIYLSAFSAFTLVLLLLFALVSFYFSSAKDGARPKKPCKFWRTRISSKDMKKHAKNNLGQDYDLDDYVSEDKKLGDKVEKIVRRLMKNSFFDSKVELVHELRHVLEGSTASELKNCSRRILHMDGVAVLSQVSREYPQAAPDVTYIVDKISVYRAP
eukprot:Platyproteum_vivax@DN14728_c0_g1_i1.p1